MDFASLQHSVFLQALGSAILNSLWQGFLLWLIYETISVSYKNASAKFKNSLGTLLLFFSFAWFCIEFVLKIVSEKGVVSIPAAASPMAGEPTVYAFWNVQTFLSYAEACLPYLSVAYIFLLTFLMARLFSAYRYVYFISNKRLMKPPADLQTFASKVAQQIGLVKKISVWISHHIDVPATIGFIKPVILIPFASVNNLSSHQLEAIILHELSHIKRNDYFTNLIISVIETILFFNPFIALLINIIKRERENCCDDFVLQYQYDPHAYASALFRLEQSRVNKLQLAIGAVSGKKQLLSRIKRITNAQVVSRQFNYGQKLLALALVTAIICSVAWLSPAEKKSIHTKMAANVVEPILSLAHTKSSVTTQEIVQKQDKNLPAIILKYISPKNNPTSLTGNVTKNQGIDDFLPVENDKEFAGAINLKQHQFAINGSGITLPPSVKIQNFPFQNMGFNFDLGGIDMSKFNNGLQQAFKEINSPDWSEIQNNINESLSKIKTDNFPKEEFEAFYIEKAKDLFKLKKDQQQYYARIFTDRLPEQKKLLLRDSLRHLELALVHENSARIQRVYNTEQTQYAEEMGSNYSFNYGSAGDAAYTKKKEIKECNENNNEPPLVVSVPASKNLRALVRRLPGFTRVSNGKKLLRLTLDDDAKNSRHQRSIINVEITELP